MNEKPGYECPTCGGDGECVTSHRYTCYDCKGSGRITDKATYEKLLEKERAAQRGFDNALRVSEYRQMGG